MKQLTCKTCGSTNLIELGESFFCPTCGTKYSASEAKKMLSEDTSCVLSIGGTAHCPICNSANLIAENGGYICRACGKQFTAETKAKKATGPVFSKKHSVFGLVFGAVSLILNLYALASFFSGDSSLTGFSFPLFVMALGASVFGFVQSIIGQSTAKKAGGSAPIVKIGSIFSTIGLIVTILGILIAIGSKA